MNNDKENIILGENRSDINSGEVKIQGKKRKHDDQHLRKKFAAKRVSKSYTQQDGSLQDISNTGKEVTKTSMDEAKVTKSSDVNDKNVTKSSDVTDKKTVMVFVSKLKEENDVDNEFKEIAGVVDITGDPTPAILLKCKEKDDTTFKEGQYYNLENYSYFSVPDGIANYILVSVETRVRSISTKKIERSYHQLESQLSDVRESANNLVDSLRTPIKIDQFSYDLKTVINLPKGESVHYLKAFVEWVGLQSPKAKYRATLIRLIDDKSGRYLTVFVPEKLVLSLFQPEHIPKPGDTVLLKKFATNRGLTFATSMLIATEISSIQKLDDDELFKHLKDFKREKKSFEVDVTSAGFALPYDACPKEKCYLKKVKYNGEGQYKCPKCKKSYPKEKLTTGRRLELKIENEIYNESKVTVFTKEIKNLMKKLKCIELRDLPDEILDKRIKTCITPGNYGLSNVLKKIEIIDIRDEAV